MQEDLDKLSIWSDNWLLKFHPDKCKKMTIGKRPLEQEEYHLNTNNREHIIEEVQTEKDIGVTIDRGLEFEAHINEKINKATRICGMIR